MNNKPVAWMDYLKHSDVYDLNLSGRGVPLYTQKELTDKDAEQALKEWEKTETFPVSSVEAHGFINGFKWAIRKAQKK